MFAGESIEKDSNSYHFHDETFAGESIEKDSSSYQFPGKCLDSFIMHNFLAKPLFIMLLHAQPTQFPPNSLILPPPGSDMHAWKILTDSKSLQ